MRKIRPALLILLIIFLNAYSVFARDDVAESSLNQTMSKIGRLMTELFPLISSDQQLTDSENRKIFHSVQTLQNLFAEAGPEIQKKSATYQMSYLLIQDYLASITTEDNPAFFPQLKQKLITLTDFCVSCHTQDSKFRTLFNLQKPPTLDSLLANAEFNFATRNYDIAGQFYEKYLFMTPGLSDSEILKALHRLLAINLQVLNNPDEARQVFVRLKSLQKLSLSNSTFINAVIEELDNLKELKVGDVDKVSFVELGNYAAQFLGNANAQQPFIFTSTAEEVQRLWLRGLLFRHLNSGPAAEEMPQILYWLAVCDRSIGYGYDYTLADFYLKQCITRYSQHPMARRCFTDYKAYVTFYFTSLTEPVLPIEIDKQLKELEKYLRKP